MTFFKKHRTLYRFQQFVTYLAVMPVLVLGSSLTLIANPPANPGDEATKDVLDKITRVRDDLGKRSLDYEDKAKNGGHDEEITKMFEEGAERYGKDWVTLFNFAQELEDSFCIISKEELKDALEALERYKNGMLGRANSREARLEESKQRLTDRVANEKDRPNGTDLPPGFPQARSFNQKQISQLKSFIKLETIMIDSMRKYAESIDQLIKQILDLRKKCKKCEDCGYSASTATAVAEVILPKGTPLVTVPIPTDSVIRFHEDATVLVSTDSAMASVDDPPTITPRRVKPGDEIRGNEIVTVLLDSGTGFITPHTLKLPDITVHTGRDPIIDEPVDQPPTPPNPTPTDPTPTDPTDPETDPENDPPPPVTLNDGALVLSILSRVPFSGTSIGTKTSSKTSTKCHFEIFVDGKKHGEAVTFTGLKKEGFKDEPVRIRTYDEEGDTLTEWETDSRVEDASIQLRFNRARYQLGESGLLLISGQDALLQAEGKRRIGHPSRPSDWKLTLNTSANVAGPPTEVPFTTHTVPFTVAGPGQLQATVTASLNQPPADFPYVVDVPLPPGIIPANLLAVIQQYFSSTTEEINDEPEDVTTDEPPRRSLPDLLTPSDFVGLSPGDWTIKSHFNPTYSLPSVPPSHLTLEEKIRWHETWIEYLTIRYTQIKNGCHDTVRTLTTVVEGLATGIKDLENERGAALQTYVDQHQEPGTFSVKDFESIRKRFDEKIKQQTQERDTASRALRQAERNASHVKDLVKPLDLKGQLFRDQNIKSGIEGRIKEHRNQLERLNKLQKRLENTQRLPRTR